VPDKVLDNLLLSQDPSDQFPLLPLQAHLPSPSRATHLQCRTHHLDLSLSRRVILPNHQRPNHLFNFIVWVLEALHLQVVLPQQVDLLSVLQCGCLLLQLVCQMEVSLDLHAK